MVTLDCRKVRLRIEVLPAFSYALHNAGLSLLPLVVAENRGDVASVPVQGQAVLDDPFGVWKWQTPSLAPGSTVNLTPILESFDYDALERVTAPIWSSLTIKADSENLRRDVLLLGCWSWPLHAGTWPALGGFVLPYDGIVRGILSAAQESWQDTASPPIEGSGSSSAIAALRMIYAYLEQTCRIRFADPLAILYERNVCFQAIRPPHRVLFNAGRLEGEGNCLDLSLLLAGCLEAVGLAPLILLTGADDEHATHALLGAWTDGRTRFRPIIRHRQAIVQAMEDGDLLALEATGLCSGSRHLGFDAALANARAAVEQATRIQAIDVKCLRPPLGRVLSLETPLDPVVLSALHEASSLAYRLRSPAFETLHILYGLSVSSGEILKTLSERCRLPQGKLAEETIRQLQRRRKGNPAGHTVGYDRCVNDARENARSQGSTVVRECDFWWALLLNESKSVDQVLAQVGSSRQQLAETLSAICPQVRPQTQNF